MLTPVEMQRTLPMTLHGGACRRRPKSGRCSRRVAAGDLARARRASWRSGPELAHLSVQLHAAAALRRARRAPRRSCGSSSAAGAYDPELQELSVRRHVADDRARPRLRRDRSCARGRARSRGLAHKWVETGEIDYQQDDRAAALRSRACTTASCRDVERLLDGAARARRATSCRRGPRACS